MQKQQPGRAEVTALVISSLREVLSQKGDPLPPEPVGESTPLIGGGSVVDSFGLVTLIIDVEQRLGEEYGLSLTLADERAMSQRNSPFRAVRSLTDYICMLIEEGAAT